MLDLCSGLGGASQAMKKRGWQVITIDINPNFKPDIVADLRQFHYTGPRPDLIWCSPPCDEFAKFAMWCWYDTSKLPEPDMSLVLACQRIIDEIQPRFWVIENVAGAVSFFNPILGKPAKILRPYYFWGYFPNFGQPRGWGIKTKNLSSSAKAKRAEIPMQLSLAIAIAIENQLELPYNTGWSARL